MNIETRILSSLEKVFPLQDPSPITVPMTCLQGEKYAFQIAAKIDMQRTYGCLLYVDIESELPVTIRRVGYVPAQLLNARASDNHYLTMQPGLFPDPLFDPEPYGLIGDAIEPLEGTGKIGVINSICGQWGSMLLEVRTEGVPAGTYPIKVNFTAKSPYWGTKTVDCSVSTSLEVVGAQLPKQDLKYTCWFHGDCLANYYHDEVFSENHWTAMENLIRMAADYGQNMILTPIFTPPLDTAIHYERPTVQLVDVALENGQYSFDFSKLTRFIKMCQNCGIEYFEISHLFSQWGGTNCPKVMATVDGEYKKIFGWETEAMGDAYKEFLKVFLGEFTAYLDVNGLRGKAYFHLTDEPSEDHLPQYKKLKEWVAPLVEGYPLMDAMSEYSYFEQGICECPAVATTALEPFLKGKRPEDFWVYYCIAQGWNNLSNRFMAMPGYRTRILGIQLYLENVAGFLQWGLNYYYSVQSLRPINPYAVTDGEGFFPAGDAFIIYPGKDRKPVASQRLLIFNEGLQDLRALKLLESLTSREHVIELIHEEAQIPVTFTEYPTGEGYILRLREKVNREIAQLSAAK